MFCEGAELWRGGDRLSRRIVRARGFWGRGIGLLGRRSWPADRALALVPCRAVHTAFMRFAIDVVFADREGRVTAVARRVPPWRAVYGGRAAVAALEWTGGALDSIDLRPGDRLSAAPESPSIPSSEFPTGPAK
jgi:uncharacterized membrane protein (UPF0127 family)